MKKRLIGILSLVLILAVLSVSAVSCTFVKENEFRTANETYVTIKHAGVTLTISYNEFMDYCNNNSRLYSYVNYYGLDVAEALDLCIKGKIQTKYLTAEAMAYLVDSSKVSAARVNALYGKGSKANPVDVLTIAERYQAIYAVNESMLEAIETNKSTAKQEAYTRAYNKLKTSDIKEVVFTDATKTYLDSFTADKVLVGDKLDTDKIKAKLVYNDGTESAEFVVPETLYTTAFSSEADSSVTAREQEKTIVITVSEDVDEGEEAIDHTLEYDYTLVYPRTTKTEPTEDTDYSVVEIDEVKVGRYASDAEIPQAVKDKCQILDLQALYADAQAKGSDKYEIEAYRLLIETIESGNHDMAYFYNSQYEAEVLTALGAEIYLKSDASFTASDVDAKIVSDFRYLAETAKKTYTEGMTDAEKREAFVAAIGSTGTGLDALYYYPAIADISDYVFVKQILFKFDAETTAFLATLRNDETALNNASEYFRKTAKVLPSNPNYDAENECPLHKLHEDGATCSYDGEGLCPAIAYGEEELLLDVMNNLKAEFDAIFAQADKTDAQKHEEAEALFDKYIYIYNDDSGTFNNNWGYLIAPEESDNSWVKEFTALGKDLIAYDPTPGNVYKASGELAWCFTRSLSGGTGDYAGVSIMMVASAPFAGVTGEFDVANMTDADVLNYLRAYTKGDGTTLYDSFKKNLRDEARTTAYSEFTKCVPTDVFERDDKNKITVDDNVKDEIDIEKKKLKENIYDLYVG